MAQDADTSPPQVPYTALIFGWWGSRGRHLRHYEELHRELGATRTVALTCSTAEMLDPPRAKLAMKTAEAALEGNEPIVAHVFSNGGMMLYRQFFASRPAAVPQLAAAVFDSTPGDLTARTFISALTATASPALRQAAALMPFAAAGTFVWAVWRRPSRAAAWIWVLVIWMFMRRHNAAYFEKCADDPIRGPCLFLYSSKDRLVSAETVERMIAERRRRAGETRIRALRWEDSPHVAHYTRHRATYRREVQSLLKDALPEHEQRQRG